MIYQLLCCFFFYLCHFCIHSQCLRYYSYVVVFFYFFTLIFYAYVFYRVQVILLVNWIVWSSSSAHHISTRSTLYFHRLKMYKSTDLWKVYQQFTTKQYRGNKLLLLTQTIFVTWKHRFWLLFLKFVFSSFEKKNVYFVYYKILVLFIIT